MWFYWLLVVLVVFHRYEGVSDWRFKRQIGTAENTNWIIEIANNCSCVLFYQCDTDGFIIKNGESLINVRIGNDKENGAENNKTRIICDGGEVSGQFICCKHRPKEEIRITPITETVLATPTTPISRTSTTKKRKPIPCGKQRIGINVRVLAGDDELTPLNGEFPWLAAIYRKDRYTNRWVHQKAGSLIHPKVVLTARHVVGRSKANELKVIVNGQIKLSEIDENPSQERNVAEVIKHPGFSSGTLYNDVAILILEEPYSIKSYINTICLRPNVDYENRRCFVAGWSETTDDDGKTFKILKKVELPAHAHEQCQSMLRNTRLGPNYVFHESFMCAGGEEGKDACNGDGGSPLVCPSGIDDTMFQVGIVAFGIECGKKGVPGVYASVGYLHSWIVERLKERDISI